MPNYKELTVKGDSIERIYGNYVANKYVVNRVYQRKLVWTQSEKVQFIDSVSKGYPVPILLLAEVKSGMVDTYEIIDGMQRLNAIMSFIENEYSVNGGYFDLNTMAATKSLLDSGKIIQREPVLERNICVGIASYTVPISIYEYNDQGEVDEVFRRINSGGRKLSRQELRMAGSTSHFARAVRVIASRTRGDASASDVLFLNDMSKISITSRDLPYGIDVEKLLWVANGILTKDQVRESMDEQLIADILSYILLTPKPSSRSEFLDDYFGFGEGEAQSKRYEAVNVATQKVSVDVLSSQFQNTIDAIIRVLQHSGHSLGKLLFDEQTARAPRYFQVVFLSFYECIVNKNCEISDMEGLVNSLRRAGKIQVAEGGRWGAGDRVASVAAMTGLIEPYFRESQKYDPAKIHWITQFENLLMQSYTEQSSYDFKQGFLRLEKEGRFDENSFDKILKTLVAMANTKKGSKGYVIIGVAEEKAVADRIATIYGVDSINKSRFFVAGIEHEAVKLGKSLDELFQLVTGKIKASHVSELLRNYIVRNIKLVKYYEKSVFILESCAQSDPSNFDGIYYERHGNELAEVKPERLPELFKRFYAGM